nr:sporulation YhaL family protein [Ornithinibacillus contaminans]
MLGMPWWVLVMLVFIVFSGYMAYRAMRAEKQLELHYIERDGQVYMKRIAEEREQRDKHKEQITN